MTRMNRVPFISTIIVVGCALTCLASVHEKLLYRQPIALTRIDQQLFVANRNSGTVSVIDTTTRAVVREVELGARFADIAAIPHSKCLIAIDERSDQAIVVDTTLKTRQRLRVRGTPVNVVVTDSFCSIASLWARRITLIDIDDAQRLKVRATVDLPFAPRHQVLSRDGRTLIVATAFGGYVATIDTRTASLISVRTIEGHNVSGVTLSADGKSVRFAQMKIEKHLPTTREMIAGGYLVGNLVRTVTIDHLSDSGLKMKPVAHWSLESVGLNGNSAGDPGELVSLSNGGMVICLTGVHEVGIRNTRFGELKRIATGAGPTDLVYDTEDSLAFVANRFDDSVSIVDVKGTRVIQTVSLGPKAPMSLSQTGEQLFHDARLSVHNWYSCQSCHPGGHTAGILNDNFSDGTSETPKRVLSLLGTGDTGPWSWNGSMTRLYDQLHRGLETTMKADAKYINDRSVAALSAFVQSLPPPPSLASARGEPVDVKAIERGQKVFGEFRCNRCHKPGFFTTAKMYDVGIHDEMGLKKINPPSLRGVSQRHFLFHDNSARSVRDVISRFEHHDVETIKPQQVDDLISYLMSL